MSRTSAEIIQIIRDNKSAIFNNLQKESIEVYNFLISTFQETEDITNNEVFKFLFRSFYRIDNAGLSSEFKKEYFQILQDFRNQKDYSNETIVLIANKLDKFLTLRNTKSFQFSFITKMLNTINVDSPIWDSEVRIVFNFQPIPNMYQKAKTSLDKKLEIAIEQLSYMKTTFNKIKESNELDETIQEFDTKYGTNELSFSKKLDFILWSTGKIIKAPKNIKSNN